MVHTDADETPLRFFHPSTHCPLADLPLACTLTRRKNKDTNKKQKNKKKLKIKNGFALPQNEQKKCLVVCVLTRALTWSAQGSHIPDTREEGGYMIHWDTVCSPTPLDFSSPLPCTTSRLEYYSNLWCGFLLKGLCSLLCRCFCPASPTSLPPCRLHLLRVVCLVLWSTLTLSTRCVW